MLRRCAFLLVIVSLLFFGGCFDSSDDESSAQNSSTTEPTPPTPDPPLPQVEAWKEVTEISIEGLYSFDLGINDATIDLGVMCSTSGYGDGNVNLPAGFGGTGNALVLHEFDSENNTWSVQGGRTTPQNYKYSELLFDNGDSYYSTNYASFGGLLAVVKNGGSGTSAMNGGLFHNIAIQGAFIYSLALQKEKAASWAGPAVEGGIGLCAYDKTKFAALGGASSGVWSREMVDTQYDKISDPCLIVAGDYLVGAYVKNEGGENDGKLYVRRTNVPDDIAGKVETNFPSFGPSLKNIREVELAWDGTKVYAATISEENELTIHSCPLNEEPLTWTVERTMADVNDVDFASTTGKVAFSVRQNDAVKVYKKIKETEAGLTVTGTFTKDGIGRLFDIEGVGELLCLSVWDATKEKLITHRFEAWK